MCADYDVAVVGSGPAGSAAALFFARNGLRVALVEAHKAPDYYKRLCTHSIRGGALPTIQRLGLCRPLDELGAVRHHEHGWTRYGWFHENAMPGRHGYNVRRKVLDPLLRSTAAAADGVDLMAGARVRELTVDHAGRVNGVIADVGGTHRLIGARLVVGADGYRSRVAEWLSDAVSDALRTGSGRDVDQAARAYQRTHRRRLLPHQLTNIDSGRRHRFTPLERLMFSAAARDQATANRVFATARRDRSPLSLLSPPALARAVLVHRRPATGGSVGQPKSP